MPRGRPPVTPRTRYLEAQQLRIVPDLKKFPLISIDPSINSLGIAYWRGPVPYMWELLTPAALTRYPSSRWDTEESRWTHKAAYVLAQVEMKIRAHSPRRVVVEWPRVRPDPQSTKSALQGDLGKLYFLCGGIAQLCWEFEKEFELIPVHRWKGQTPKEVTARRVHRSYGITKENHNVIDAIGIGRWWFRNQLRMRREVNYNAE